MPAPPSQRSIGGRGLCGCLRPSPLAKWTARASPPRFLQLSRHRFQSRLSCCRGSREEAFASPRLYWLSIARQFSRGRASARQLRNVRRDPPHLVFGEQLGRRSPPRLTLIIDVGELLPVGVPHDETVRRYFRRPRRREAAGGHDLTCKRKSSAIASCTRSLTSDR